MANKRKKPANKKHTRPARSGAAIIRVDDGDTVATMPMAQFLATASKRAAAAAKKLKPGASVTLKEADGAYTIKRLSLAPRAGRRGKRSRGGRAARKLGALRAKLRRSRKPAPETVAAAEIEYSEAKKNYHESGENLRALHEAEAKG